MSEKNETQNNKPQPKITPEQLMQLLAMQQQGALKPQMTKSQMTVQKFLTGFVKHSQTLLQRLDRFVNFITKTEDSERNDVVQAARSPILFGVYVIMIFVVFGGLWSGLAPLNSAVVAIGTLVSSTNKKVIQHQEGGIIKHIFVKQGDQVKAGDKLVELEDTKTKASYEEVLSAYRTALANESRLIAERDNEESITYPEFLLNSKDIPEVEKLITTQENLFKSKREVFRAEKESLKQRIAQSHKQNEGYIAKKTSITKNLSIARDRLKAMEGLMQKGFATKNKVLELEGQEADIRSNLASIESEIARNQQEITRIEIELMNVENKRITETLRELKETQAQAAAMHEKYIALADSLTRIVIKSPVDGIVNNMYVHTIGGVVGSGGPLLEVSPTNDTLVIEARVPHKNIDVVHVGLVAKIRFSAFKSRTTPSFTGKVISISPDIVQDRNQDPRVEPVYIARVEIDMEEFNKIAKVKKLELHPGMQTEVQIVTGTRTLLKYLLAPVTDTMFKAFREK